MPRPSPSPFPTNRPNFFVAPSTTIESLKNSSTRCELLASRCSSTPSKDPHVEKEEYHPKCALSSRHSELTPIIFISAINYSDTHLSRGYSLGAVDYILAPIVPEILRAKVSVFIDLHRKTEQLKRQAETQAQLIREQAARAQAEAANKAKDRFLAMLSHELRTPLTPVLFTSSNLSQDPTVPTHIREALKFIERNVELETRLIDDLLDVTQITQGKLKLTFETADAHELLRSALEICSN